MTLTQELKDAGKKRRWAKLSARWDNTKHEIKCGWYFVRDFITALALTVLIGYGIDKALRTERHASPLQIAVVFSGCLILLLALSAWHKVVRNYQAEK